MTEGDTVTKPSSDAESGLASPQPAPQVAASLGSDGSELAALVSPLWTADHTSQVLGLDHLTLLDRRQAGSLLALKSADDDTFYPVWQFENHDGEVRVKPALRKFLMVLRDQDSWTVAVLIHTPAPELGGLTPLDWVGQGNDIETLVGYANVVNREWAR